MKSKVFFYIFAAIFSIVAVIFAIFDVMIFFGMIEMPNELMFYILTVIFFGLAYLIFVIEEKISELQERLIKKRVVVRKRAP